MRVYDFDLTIEGEAPQVLRVRRETLDEARLAAEELAADVRIQLGATLKHYSLKFVRALSLSSA